MGTLVSPPPSPPVSPVGADRGPAYIPVGQDRDGTSVAAIRENSGMTIDPADIAVEETASRGRYVYRDGAGNEAEMTYSRAGAGLIIIDHTEVPDAFRGQGVGLALVTRAVADARAAGRQILPLCPFARAQFRRHPEWSDVLHQRKEA